MNIKQILILTDKLKKISSSWTSIFLSGIFVPVFLLSVVQMKNFYTDRALFHSNSSQILELYNLDTEVVDYDTTIDKMEKTASREVFQVDINETEFSPSVTKVKTADSVRFYNNTKSKLELEFLNVDGQIIQIAAKTTFTKAFYTKGIYFFRVGDLSGRVVVD